MATGIRRQILFCENFGILRLTFFPRIIDLVRCIISFFQKTYFGIFSKICRYNEQSPFIYTTHHAGLNIKIDFISLNDTERVDPYVSAAKQSGYLDGLPVRFR
jgi:hypothetical protein